MRVSSTGMDRMLHSRLHNSTERAIDPIERELGAQSLSLFLDHISITIPLFTIETLPSQNREATATRRNVPSNQNPYCLRRKETVDFSIQLTIHKTKPPQLPRSPLRLHALVGRPSAPKSPIVILPSNLPSIILSIRSPSDSLLKKPP